ncbi:MAG: hypothetical protein IPO08_23075 [Xanthomonadales bacterium]|nr:hypothetical protein [Xanthomonadales bacterium]
MTKQYNNELKGVFFKNDDKASEQHPDYKGSATVGGVDYFMDAWVNTADSGRKYMSVKFKEKTGRNVQAPAPANAPRAQQRPAQAQAPRQSTGTKFDEMDDDIPWN